MDFVNFEGFPDSKIMDQILTLHEHIFNDPDTLVHKAQSKQKILFTVCLQNDKVLGYKIGYELDTDCFYSWLGGVEEKHRNIGIASRLMDRQHLYLKEKGYNTIQTKTKNRWRNMLLLNIKKGFDVIGTYTDSKGEPKIILQKPLTDVLPI